MKGVRKGSRGGENFLPLMHARGDKREEERA